MPNDGHILFGTKYSDAELKQFEQTEEINAMLGDDCAPDESDPIKVGGTPMPWREQVARQQEKEARVRARGIPEGWEQFLHVKARMGRVMHHSEFLPLLRKLIPSLIVRGAVTPGRLSLYRVINKLAADGSHDYVKYIGWMEAGYSPEFEINLVDEHGVPAGQRRGWRTILLRLQTSCDEDTHVPVLTERHVLEVFGEPSNGETAANYRQRLYEWRNRK